ncbi:hypothetical protein [Anabaena azotica]|nr:hypothetical protein [Anabaena azotica]
MLNTWQYTDIFFDVNRTSYAGTIAEAKSILIDENSQSKLLSSL